MQDDWVELYNPTSEAVDIGGWVMSSILKRWSEVWTIPSDTVLNPGECIVYEKHEDWFSFQSALVHIHNDGILIDHTTLIKDDILDSHPLYRTYHGVKADSAKFWSFGLMNVFMMKNIPATITYGPSVVPLVISFTMHESSTPTTHVPVGLNSDIPAA